MTYDQGIRIATRSIACYLTFWAISDLIDIPRELMEIAHYWTTSASLIFIARVEIMYAAANVLKAALWLLAALWFYRCGPWVVRFFREDEDLQL